MFKICRRSALCVCIGAISFIALNVNAQTLRSMEIRDAHVRMIWVSSNSVLVGLVDPPSDSCGTEFQYKFLLSEIVGGVPVETSYGKKFLSTLVLAKINQIPVRIKYMTDAPVTVPIRRDNCNDVTPDRVVANITGLGIDN